MNRYGLTNLECPECGELIKPQWAQRPNGKFVDYSEAAALKARVAELEAALSTMVSCFQCSILWDQKNYDSPPEPAHEWDRAAFALLTQVQAFLPEPPKE